MRFGLVFFGLLGLILCLCFPCFAQGEKGGGFEKDEDNFVIKPYEKLWIISIGISKYKIDNYSLDFGAADAKQVAALFEEKFQVQKTHIQLLQNKNATYKNIKTALGSIAPETGDEDAVIIYFSGHGQDMLLPDGGRRGYLVPYEGDMDNLYATCIDMDELRKIAQMLKARHILFLVDSCYSGIAGVQRSIPSTNSFNEVARMSRFTSRQIITAGRGTETTVELSSLRHGAFTFWLLEGLSGKADVDQNGYILGTELFYYLLPRVKDQTNYLQTPQLFALAGGYDGDFVLYSPAAETAPDMGTLVVDTIPWVRIYVDGKFVDDSPAAGISVLAGLHSIRVVNKKENVDKTFMIEILPGKKRFIINNFEVK